jgi:hypothetical protein
MRSLELALSILLLALPAVWADEQEAEVTTPSGTYIVPVEVEDGQVTHVIWPNGGHMHVIGADIENGEADGTNLQGDSVHVELDESSSGGTEAEENDD